MKDDAAFSGTLEALITFRITSAKDFAADSVVARAAANPTAIPMLVIGDAAKKVERTKTAIDYEGEVTCIVTTRESNRQLFTALILQPGHFVVEQPVAMLPQWITKLDKESDRDYWARASRIKTEKARKAHLQS